MAGKMKKLIDLEEYVRINGIEQFLFHQGKSYDNPVMLFLHGGPGSAESVFTELFQEKWEDIYTVVHWDQRGAGKTLNKNPDKYPTVELMLQDLYEIVQHLKKKYNKDKIVILGHSWGSALGTIFIRKHSEEVTYYIGVGQVINMLENERVGYEKLKEAVIQAKDQKSLKKLEAIGEYPGDKFDSSSLPACGKVRNLQGKYNLAVKVDFSLIRSIIKSPIFKWSDISAMAKGLKANQKTFDFLGGFDLNSESAEYKVPVYYILGERDWQTPYTLAQKYFEKLEAPIKKLYMIPDAGHMTMMDQPELFFKALMEINSMH